MPEGPQELTLIHPSAWRNRLEKRIRCRIGTPGAVKRGGVKEPRTAASCRQRPTVKKPSAILQTVSPPRRVLRASHPGFELRVPGAVVGEVASLEVYLAGLQRSEGERIRRALVVPHHVRAGARGEALVSVVARAEVRQIGIGKLGAVVAVVGETVAARFPALDPAQDVVGRTPGGVIPSPGRSLPLMYITLRYPFVCI